METPSVELNGEQRRRKRENERINKRIETLVDKAFALGELDGINVALIICKRGQYTTYKSRGFLSQQPLFTKIQNTYPLPKNLLPEDIENRRSKEFETEDIEEIKEE
ncbi:hypothetical protein IFR05_002080 [Cadophora sp. M221]|nr:hypothetical protein IFR05_002080 [Cadophora sp. M221]